MVTLTSTCAACGRNRKYKKLVFTGDAMTAYCANVEECNELHPNSLENTRKRGGRMLGDLISYEAALEIFNDRQIALGREATRGEEDDLILFMVGKYGSRSISSRFPLGTLVGLSLYMEKNGLTAPGTAIAECLKTFLTNEGFYPDDPNAVIHERRLGVEIVEQRQTKVKEIDMAKPVDQLGQNDSEMELY